MEVLLLSDPVDSFWPERLGTYEGKSLRNVAQGLNDLEKFGAPEASTAEKADMDTLLPALKTALGDAVSDIRATDRLVSSAMVLSAPEGGPDLQLRKLMQRSGQDIPDVTPVLELNPAHPIIHSLAQKVQAGDNIDTLAHILLDVASIQNGETPKDVNAFSRRIMDYLAGGTQDANAQ